MEVASIKKMSQPVQAVILCGGLGTRLQPFTKNMPKPMVPCNGKPFLWHLLKQLNEKKIKRFVLLTGYFANMIESYFGNGSKWGWRIDYSEGPVEWDTGKRIWEAKELIDDRFLLLYSDNFVSFPLDKMLTLHEKNQNSITLMVAPKESGNIELDKDGIVINYDNNRLDKALDYVEIGYMIVEKDKTLSVYDKPECNFSSVLRKMATQKQIIAWVQNDQYHSISDPARWKKTEEYLKPKKIILIDRDGVINRKAPRGKYIAKWEEIRWIPETLSAMKSLSKKGFKFIVISNQAGVARGMIELVELNKIHLNMKSKLQKDGIEILDIYVCPHHWDEGCICRKPSPGMLFQASNDHLFRLDKTLFIGDDPRDCQAAERAGCNSIFIGSKLFLEDLVDNEKPIISVDSLIDSIPIIENHMDQ